MNESIISLTLAWILIAVCILKARGTRKLSDWFMAWLWPAAFVILFVQIFFFEKDEPPVPK